LLLARLYLQVAAVIEHKVLEEQDRDQSQSGQTRDSTAAQPRLESCSDLGMSCEADLFTTTGREARRIVAAFSAREQSTAVGRKSRVLR
jgi:hypothetical protein